MVTPYMVYTFSDTSVKTNVYALLEPHCKFKCRKYNNILFQTKKIQVTFLGKWERV